MLEDIPVGLLAYLSPDERAFTREMLDERYEPARRKLPA